MTLSVKIYKSFDAIRLTYRASPRFMPLKILLTVIQALMATLATALSLAHFVDTATSILNGGRQYNDIYMALLFVLLVLGVNTTIGVAIQLVSSRIALDLQRELLPAVIEVNARLDFKHIENNDSWELISRVSKDPVTSVTKGFDAFLQITQIVIAITSMLSLIVFYVWWAALLIVVFSVPMFRLSFWAGKKNYQAVQETEKFNRRQSYLDEVLTSRENIDERTLFGYGDEVADRWRNQYEEGRILEQRVHARTWLLNKGSSIILALIAVLAALTLIGPVTTQQLSAGMFMGIMSAMFECTITDNIYLEVCI